MTGGGLWGTLLPLIVASAVVPVQITLTVLLLRSSVGAAAAWVGGMTATRLAQGVLFGLVFAGAESESGDGTGLVEAGLLLVIAVLLLTTAVRTLLGGSDEDDLPPKWMKLTASVTPGRAFLLGAGFVAVAAKLWVFTLGAIGSIEEAALGWWSSIAVFLLFVILAESLLIALVAYAALAPGPSQVLLGRVSAWLERHSRTIVIVLGLVFGTWFLLKALSGLGAI
jgi:hypothetical protein